ncbi:MAG TPA: hypothetical protein VGR90_03410, partial [Acidimicrobiales bacterium]|nr:hypothetical protein [Acidimicrobiales bacterium]
MDASGIGRYWADRVYEMLSACVTDRDLIPSDRSLDIRFQDLIADDLRVARDVFACAGQPLDDTVINALTSYGRTHERGRMGAIDYRASDVGLDPD